MHVIMQPRIAHTLRKRKPKTVKKMSKSQKFPDTTPPLVPAPRVTATGNSNDPRVFNVLREKKIQRLSDTLGLFSRALL